jgi:hypothetical protein
MVLEGLLTPSVEFDGHAKPGNESSGPKSRWKPHEHWRKAQVLESGEKTMHVRYFVENKGFEDWFVPKKGRLAGDKLVIGSTSHLGSFL